jgi:hypothetical protein
MGTPLPPRHAPFYKRFFAIGVSTQGHNKFYFRVTTGPAIFILTHNDVESKYYSHTHSTVSETFSIVNIVTNLRSSEGSQVIDTADSLTRLFTPSAPVDGMRITHTAFFLQADCVRRLGNESNDVLIRSLP